MNKMLLEQLRQWFNSYVNGFYGQDEYINNHIRLKHDHTHRTCQEILYLAGEMGLDENDKVVAETIALLHDVGRFEQFAGYRTYNDLRSVDHCALAVELIRRYKLLRGLTAAEKHIVTAAIEFHGAIELPGGLDHKGLLFARLIRDADKIDVLYVVTEHYQSRCIGANSDGFELELEYPDVDGYTPEVLEDVLAGRRTDYRKLRTLNDLKLLQLGWVYDVNFTATLKRIKQRGLLEKLAGFLPADSQMERVKTIVLRYVDERINKANGPQL